VGNTWQWHLEWPVNSANICSHLNQIVRRPTIHITCYERTVLLPQHRTVFGWVTMWNSHKHPKKNTYLNVKNCNSHGVEVFPPPHAASQFVPCSHQHHCTWHLVSPQLASLWLWGQSLVVRGCESGTCCDPHCNIFITDHFLPLICNTYLWTSKEQVLSILHTYCSSPFNLTPYVRFPYQPHK
jgi:hypothetical protein